MILRIAGITLAVLAALFAAYVWLAGQIGAYLNRVVDVAEVDE